MSEMSRRAEVILDRLELAHRDARERGVLAVGGEHPRVVGEAGTHPAGARYRPRGRRELLALVGPANLQVFGDSREIQEVLLAPVDRRLEALVAWQREPGEAAPALALSNLDRELGARIAKGGLELATSLRRSLVGARRGDPQGL